MPGAGSGRENNSFQGDRGDGGQPGEQELNTEVAVVPVLLRKKSVAAGARVTLYDHS